MDALTTKFTELEQRVATMEKNQRRLRVLSIALFASTVLMTGEAFLAPKRRKVVEAERFVVRDAQGQRRAELGLAEVGLPQLNLYDERGREQIGLQAFADRSSSLAFHDGNRTQLSIESTAEGTSAVRLIDQDNLSHATLYMLPKGRSGLTLNHDRESVLMGVNPGAAPGLVVTDMQGRETGTVGGSTVSARSFGMAHLGAPFPDPDAVRIASEVISPYSVQAIDERPALLDRPRPIQVLNAGL